MLQDLNNMRNSGTIKNVNMIKPLKYLICLFLLILKVNAIAQPLSICGTVTDENGHSVTGATVFITNSSHAAASGNSGGFCFADIPSGTYEIAVRMMGFEPYTQNVVVKTQSVILNIRLKQSNTFLKAVTINGKPDPNRDDYLRQFLKYFIGETINAKQCKLVNPQVLNFHYNRGTKVLKADADDFIVIENKGLGYYINYLLKDFELDMNGHVCTIIGSPYFKEMAGTKEEQVKWAINRRIAYLSSSRHFFRAVIDNTAKKEGYLIYQPVYDSVTIAEVTKRSKPDILRYYQQLPTGNIVRRYAIRIHNINSIFKDAGNGFKTLKPTNNIDGFFVLNTNEMQPPLFYRTGNPIDFPVISLPKKIRNNMQVANIMPRWGDTVMIDRNYEWPARGFTYSGYWSWLKIADLTPLDYFVEPILDDKITDDDQ